VKARGRLLRTRSHRSPQKHRRAKCGREQTGAKALGIKARARHGQTSGGRQWRVTANKVSVGSAESNVCTPRPTSSRVTKADGRSPGSRGVISRRLPWTEIQSGVRQMIYRLHCGGSYGIRENPRTVFPFDPHEGNRRRHLGVFQSRCLCVFSVPTNKRHYATSAPHQGTKPLARQGATAGSSAGMTISVERSKAVPAWNQATIRARALRRKACWPNCWRNLVRATTPQGRPARANSLLKSVR
jgi:hypothetical protein